MIKFLILLICVLFINTFVGATGIGIGVVIIDFNAKTVVQFYDSPLADGKLVKKIAFMDDRANKVWKIKNWETEKSWMKPEAYDPQYDMLAFRCKSKQEGWLEVIVNNKTAKTYWVQANEVDVFTDWFSFLSTKTSCIKRLNVTNPVYVKPDESADKVDISIKECFAFKSIQEDWMEVVSSDKTYWIKWLNGEEVLIKYLFK